MSPRDAILYDTFAALRRARAVADELRELPSSTRGSGRPERLASEREGAALVVESSAPAA